QHIKRKTMEIAARQKIWAGCRTFVCKGEHYGERQPSARRKEAVDVPVNPVSQLRSSDPSVGCSCCRARRTVAPASGGHRRSLYYLEERPGGRETLGPALVGRAREPARTD